MIYITGDCHRDFKRFSTRIFPEQKEMIKEDYVIICGDFGGVWSKGKEDKEEKYLLDWLENKPFTTLFVDGNHENFDRLYAYPAEEWHGGRVHMVRPSVIHMMRGQVFEIEGKHIFTFGGASSHDIDGGILEPEDPNLPSDAEQPDDPTLPPDTEQPVDPNLPPDTEQPVDPVEPSDTEEPVDPNLPVDPPAVTDPPAPSDTEEPVEPDLPPNPFDTSGNTVVEPPPAASVENPTPSTPPQDSGFLEKPDGAVE